MMGGSFLGRNDWCHFFFEICSFQKLKVETCNFLWPCQGQPLNPKPCRRAKAMGKTMKAMKATPKKTKQTETSPAQGHSPAKGQSLAKGPGMLKRPSSILKLPKNDADLSLEEKMEAFQKKANGNVQTFLDSLTQGQREALWGRFSRARDALKDTKATELWNTHCKGKGSEEKKNSCWLCF